MNILQLEQKRASLKEKLVGAYSNQSKLLFLYNFFEKALSTKNTNLIDSYLPEFIPEYIHLLKSWSVTGLKPRTCLAGMQVHESIIEQAEKSQMNELTKEYQKFPELIIGLKKDVEKLKKILNGEQIETVEPKAFFPLLDEEGIVETGFSIGILESVTIKINKTRVADKFIIIPSEKEIEEKINEQVKLSWINAKRTVKKYIRKIYPYHEVIISFDNKVGFCKGNSLGTALTLSFIEELLKTYNSPVAVTVGNDIAFTGGLDETGRITNTSEKIIKQKTELIFFSDISHFAVPKSEEAAAIEQLNELKQEYPKRDLKITGIEDLNDLLNRRNLVEIKKINPAVRSAKFARKNWVALSTIFILIAIISLFILRDIDTNPVSFRVDGAYLYVLNKNGKVLWQKRAITNASKKADPNELKDKLKIVDIDLDGRNELLITIEEFGDAKPDSEFTRISCYDSEGEPVWRYSFKDIVSSERTNLPPIYAIMIIDTVTVRGIKNLFLFSNNSQSFSSAIYRLDLKNGKRIPGTLWCSGHTQAGMITDINNDGRKDILCVGQDNGYEDAVFFGFDIDTLTEVRPTTSEYLIRDFPVSDLITYIRFPKTDYDVYRNYRTPGLHPYGFKDVRNFKYYQFIVDSHMDDFASTLWYQVDYNLKDVNIIVDNRFRVMRDTLVAHGKLPLPYTDTPEYVELQKSKILYWQNGKWAKREELD